MKSILLLIPLLLGLNDPNPNAPNDKLIGSWNLVQYKYGADENYSDVPEFMYYVKNITRNNFSWCSYNPEDGEVIGTGGGTYEIVGKKYIESTDFWYPSGTSIPGTKTAFDYKIKGNRWVISGYIKEVELQPATGEMAPIDSMYIEEIWMRISD
jgi:hypothetical protein